MLYKILFLPVGDYFGHPWSGIDREFSNKRKAKRFLKKLLNRKYQTMWRTDEGIIYVIKEHTEIVRIK